MSINEYRKLEFAKMLRQEQTNCEDIVWNVLRNRRFCNLKFKRQHILRGFVIDFYCYELKLAIEIDGKIHEDQKEYDKFRQNEIELKGITFIRITNEEIRKDINILLNKIHNILK